MAIAPNQSTGRRFWSKNVGGKHLLVAETVPSDQSGKTATQTITLSLFDSRSAAVAVASKTFTWAESALPEVTLQERPSLLIILKGRKSVAQLPFTIPKRSMLKLPEGTRFKAPVSVKSSFTSGDSRPKAGQSLSFIALTVLEEPTSDQKWEKLIDACNQNRDPTVFNFSVSVPKEDQLALIKIVVDRFIKTKNKDALHVFLTLIEQRIVTTSAFGDILSYLIEKDLYKLLIAFIRSKSTVVVDEAFVHVLKYAIGLKQDQTEEVFFGLVSKGFTASFLRKHFAELLTAAEAVKVLNLGVDVLDAKASNDVVCERIIELLLSLIDSNCDKLIWEDDAYAALKRAKDYVQSMADMTSAFTRLLSKNKALSQLPDLGAGAETDYVIQKVAFTKTTESF
uniref:Mic1 domain-containing protein n=1 Tax=Panagrellus redivivus TaxID=6233 RepID=A0A7E4ZRJ7_PANRE